MFIGLLELEPGTILFARPLREDGIYREEDDIAESWCLDGYAHAANVVLNTLTQFVETNFFLMTTSSNWTWCGIYFWGRPRK